MAESLINKLYEQLREQEKPDPEQIQWKPGKKDNWTLLPDGRYDVDGDIDLSDQHLTTLPYRFRNVSGNFSCSKNKLTSLAGAPREVSGGFVCSHNNLTSLEGAPREVGGDFSCFSNKLTSLEGAPVEVGGGYFSCSHNLLTSLEGAPVEVGGYFSCSHNLLTSLVGSPEKVGGKIYSKGNLIEEKLDPEDIQWEPKIEYGDMEDYKDLLMGKMGTLYASYNYIVAKIGPPKVRFKDEKVQAMWFLHDYKARLVVIYNYKSDQELERNFLWSIASDLLTRSAVAELLHDNGFTVADMSML